VTSFQRKCFVIRHAHRENHGFKRLFIQLKRCYPLPDWAIAELLDVDLREMWRWRNGRTRPRKLVIRFMGYLIAWRIGAATNVRELLRVKKLIATEQLESMVDDFLEREAAFEARRQCAKTGRYRPQTLSWTQKS